MIKKIIIKLSKIKIYLINLMIKIRIKIKTILMILKNSNKICQKNKMK
jgi:hypothetical protein